jgi:hypothetical protein
MTKNLKNNTMTQQNAVDVLWENLTSLFFFTDGIPIEAMEIYDKAKEMHEKQIKDAYEKGETNGIKSTNNANYTSLKTSEQYYNETFKK